MTQWLFLQAIKNPNKTYVISEGSRFSFADVENLVCQTTDNLKKIGVGTSDHVAIRANHSIRYIVLFHALARIGAVVVPLNVRLSENQVMEQIKRSDCTFLIEGESFHSEIEVKRHCLENIVVMNMLEKSQMDQQFGKIEPDQPLAIFFTSGTTGHSKGAVLTFNNIYYNAIGSEERLGIEESDLWVLTLPLYHVGGMSIVFRGAIYGIGIILLSKFSLDETCKAIERGGTILSLVPTMLYRFLRERKGSCLANLRCLLLGGAKANRSLVEQALKERIPLYTTYGLTEATSQVATATPDEVRKYPETVGKPIKGMEVKVMAKNGKVGEILIKGPCLMKGYYNDEKKTQEAIKDGWFYTGDLGRMENGMLFTFGRRKDLIVCGGENIYPAEIEAVLQGVDEIEESCAVGVPDEEWGEVVGVAVVPKPRLNDLENLEKKIVQIVIEKLGSFKRPKKVIFLDYLPKTSSGKVIRDKIAALFQK